MWFLNFSKAKFLLILFYILVVKGEKTETLIKSVPAKKETKSSFTSRILNNKEVMFNYERINQAFYSELGINQIEANKDEENQTNYIINLTKNHLNYSINDGIFMEFDINAASSNSTLNKPYSPKHIRFSFKIEKENPDKYSEQCNLRLTNSSLNDLRNNSYRTFNSDPLFFRVRTNNSIVLNDKYFYYTNFTENNYDSNFKSVDIFFNWDTNKILALFDKKIIDNTLTYAEMLTDFYHKNLNMNYTNPNKIILYNFHPNTSCSFRNLELCRDFCDQGFNERLQHSFEKKIEKLPEAKKKEILEIRSVEEERDALVKEFEEEVRNLELKYDKLIQKVYEKRTQRIKECTIYPDFWLRVISNHKIIRDFISEEDKKVLKHLKDLRYAKLDDGLSFKLIFEFEPNDYFTNPVIEKVYNMNKEMLIDTIKSTKIDWKEGKNVTEKIVVKVCKNKNTGEKREIERKEDLPSFFHFFTNLKTPSEEEIKNVKFEIEKELGGHFDMEYELGLEFIEEIIPYASQFFAGVARDEEEYHEYVMDQRENKI